MCGLYGWKLAPEVLEQISLHTLAASLAFQADTRGNESWGVLQYGLNDAKEAKLVKSIGSIKKTCKIKDILSPMVLGHTRKATTGAISVPNAHPFEIGNTIGAHNGFIHNHEDLNKEYKRDFEVDSQHLIAHIDEGRSMQTLSGMGTVTYIKKDDPSTIYFGRGSSSDLDIYGIGTVENCYGLVWASRGFWVSDALDMAGCEKYFPYDTKPLMMYVSDGFELQDVEEFDLRFHASTTTSPASRARYVPKDHSYSDGYGRVQWHGAAYQDPELEEWRKKYKQEHDIVAEVTDEMVRDFPTAVKKTQEEHCVVEGQGSQASLPTRCCSGCRRYGSAVDDFEDNARGVVWFTKVADYLCFQCAAYYEGETVRPTPGIPVVITPVDRVPNLRLWEGGE